MDCGRLQGSSERSQRDHVGSEIFPRPLTTVVRWPVCVSSKMSALPFEKMRCRESAPHTGSCPSATVRTAPVPRSRMLTWNPPLRVLKATLFPSGDQFGSVLKPEVEIGRQLPPLEEMR